MRISIFVKLALTFLVTIAGLVAFLGVSAAREFELSFSALVQAREETVSSGIESEVNILLEELESRLNGMKDNPDFTISLIDRLEETAPPGELIDRMVDLRNIAALDFLWLISPDGIVLASGHDENEFGYNLLEPQGTYSGHVTKALDGERVRAVSVEAISVSSEFVAEVFLPVIVTDRFLGRDQVIGILWGAEKIDTDFITRSANLAGGEIVAVAPGVDPIVSWQTDDAPVDPEFLSSLSENPDEVSLGGESYQLATGPFPQSVSDGDLNYATLHLLVPKSDIINRRRTLLQAILVESVFGGIVAILLAFLIAKSITLPIERLKTAVTSMASGEMSGRVEAHSRDEVEDLVKSFNKMADELDTNTRRLVEAEKLSAWREVARRLAHEIKNPLSPIKLSVQNLRRVYSGNPEKFSGVLDETCETVLEEVDRLKTLADEFSNFARMPKPVLSVNDLGEIVKGSVALFDKPEIGAKIEFNCPDDLPLANIDRDALSRVFTNLIKNAVEAMSGRDGVIRVNLRTVKSQQETWIRVTIIDEGVGMDREELKQSFNPYFTTKRGGSGLGLAIVQSIVSEHRGRIRMDSEPGKGTMVTIEVPAVK